MVKFVSIEEFGRDSSGCSWGVVCRSTSGALEILFREGNREPKKLNFFGLRPGSVSAIWRITSELESKSTYGRSLRRWVVMPFQSSLRRFNMKKAPKNETSKIDPITTPIIASVGKGLLFGRLVIEADCEVTLEVYSEG